MALKILKGPTDEETYAAFQKLQGEEIFNIIIKHSLKGDRWFGLAVEKGFIKGMPPEEILIKAAQGGSQIHVKSAHEKLLQNKDHNVKPLLLYAFIEASKNGRLNVLKYLIDFIHANFISYVLLTSKDQDCIEFALKKMADLNHK